MARVFIVYRSTWWYSVYAGVVFMTGILQIFFVVVCTDITDTLFLHKLQIIQQISSGQVIL